MVSERPKLDTISSNKASALSRDNRSDAGLADQLTYNAECDSNTGRMGMPIAVVYRAPAMTAEQYRESWTGDPPVAPPLRLISHAGIGDGPAFFTVTVWESRAAYEAFAPVFAQAMRETVASNSEGQRFFRCTISFRRWVRPSRRRPKRSDRLLRKGSPHTPRAVPNRRTMPLRHVPQRENLNATPRSSSMMPLSCARATWSRPARSGSTRSAGSVACSLDEDMIATHVCRSDGEIRDVRRHVAGDADPQRLVLNVGCGFAGNR